MINKINKIKARISFNTIYTCRYCGSQKVGDTITINYKGTSTSELKEYLDSIPQQSRDMPIGWGFNDKFYCGCHKKNK